MTGYCTFKILSEEITYTGEELRPHFGLEKTKVYGNLITAFIGSCDVQTEKLVDMEDRLAADHIKAKSMLHFIGEFFGITLESGVLYQRLFITHAERILRRQWPRIERKGDDLLVEGRKLSVSIATVSPNSVLIHWGININSTGAPVSAIGLGALDWDQERVFDFAKEVLTQYIAEIDDIQMATVKVRPVF